MKRPKFADRPKYQQILVKIADSVMYNYNPVFVLLQKWRYAKIMSSASMKEYAQDYLDERIKQAAEDGEELTLNEKDLIYESYLAGFRKDNK